MTRNLKDLWKGLLAVPGVTVAADLLRQTELWTTMLNTVWGVDAVLSAGNSLANPLFSSSAISGLWLTASTFGSMVAAPLLTNDILKKIGIENKYLRYWTNIAAAWGAYIWGTAVAPFIMWAGAAYALGKPAYKVTKEVLNRTAGTIWGLTGWAVAWGVRSAWQGIKGKQFDGSGLGRVNPKF